MEIYNKKGIALIMVEDNYEDLELHYPRLRLIEEGYTIYIVGPKKGHNYYSKHQYVINTTHTFPEINPKEIKILIIPGGFCSDRLRRYSECCKLVSDIWNSGSIVAFICHGGWLPISAKIVKGKKLTSFFAIKDDLINAGANWIDEKSVIDGKMITAQTPDDLPLFMKNILKVANEF